MLRLRFICIIPILLWLTSCGGPKFGLAPLPAEQAVSIESEAVELFKTNNSQFTIQATKYRLNYNFELRLAAEEQNQLLVVATNPKNTLKQKPIFLFDLNSGKILWQIMSLTPEFRVNFNSELTDKIIFEAKKVVYTIDRKTGQTIWNRGWDYRPLDVSKNLAYTKIDTGFHTGMEVFNIQTGETLWNRSGFKYGWWGSENQIISDTTWLAAGDGLHTFNLKTGAGWDIDVPTNATGGVGKVVALAVLSAIGGGYSNAKTDRYDDLTSNALIVGDQVYYAGNRILIRADLKTGAEKWRINVPKIAAHSVLFEEDDHILMVGLGWCHKNYRISDYSIPWVGRFNKSDGKQTLYKPLGSKTRLLDYRIEADGYYLLTRDKLYFMDRLRPEDILLESQNDQETTEKFGANLSMIDHPENYFIQSDSDSSSYIFLPDFKTDLTFGWVKTTKGMIQFDKELNTEQWFPGRRTFTVLAEQEDLALIHARAQKPAAKKRGKDDQIIPRAISLIDLSNRGKALTEIKTTAEVSVIEDKLIIWEADQFTVQSLDHLFNKYRSSVEK